MPHFFVFHIFGKVKVFCNSDFKMKHEQNLQTGNRFQKREQFSKKKTEKQTNYEKHEHFLRLWTVFSIFRKYITGMFLI